MKTLTTKQTEYLSTLLVLIQMGDEKDNGPIPAWKLGNILNELSGVKTFQPQSIRSMVNELRQIGNPILACHGGYYMAKTQAEAMEWILSAKGRIEIQKYAIDGVYNAMKELPMIKR